MATDWKPFDVILAECAVTVESCTRSLECLAGAGPARLYFAPATARRPALFKMTLGVVPRPPGYSGPLATGPDGRTDWRAVPYSHIKTRLRGVLYPLAVCQHGAGFNVTYEIVTPESAAAGDAEERGHIVCNVSLRDAIPELLAVRDAIDRPARIEANEWPLRCPRWLTVYNDPDSAGDCESRSLHFPEWLTAASRLRILRLIESSM